jgi:serine/threonine-protein kinase
VELQRKAVSRTWLARSGDEEARASLQSRISLYAMLVLVSIVTEIALLTISYALYPSIKPGNADKIAAAGTMGLIILAVLWRGVIARSALTVASLYRIDLLIAAGIGAFLAAGAYFAYDLRPASYTAMILAYGLVFTRALIVPSSGTRTAVITSIICAPLAIAGVGLALRIEQEVPPPVFIGGACAFGIVAVILAATGSQIIYGLRRQVSEAMQLGQYTLDRKIGEGGMGVVYRAHHAMLRRPTAVKLLLPHKVGAADTLDRFEREVQSMSQLTHPNTVAVFDYGRNHDGVLYYAMEYLDGINLEELVHVYGPQPAARIAWILEQVCGALSEAHAKGFTHRDIKPPNIILCERGGMSDVAKVVDFGLVKEITASTSASTQVILGTPHYIAPEAVNDPSQVGPPADIYALGAVAYFLLTAKRVFDGKTAVDICVQHVTVQPVPPSKAAEVQVPPELEALVLRCLAKTPAERPTALELAKLLRALARTDDWSDDAAARWWKDFHQRAPITPDTSTPTITITVDIGQRSSD